MFDSQTRISEGKYHYDVVFFDVSIFLLSWLEVLKLKWLNNWFESPVWRVWGGVIKRTRSSNTSLTYRARPCLLKKSRWVDHGVVFFIKKKRYSSPEGPPPLKMILVSCSDYNFLQKLGNENELYESQSRSESLVKIPPLPTMSKRASWDVKAVRMSMMHPETESVTPPGRRCGWGNPNHKICTVFVRC